MLTTRLIGAAAAAAACTLLVACLGSIEGPARTTTASASPETSSTPAGPEMEAATRPLLPPTLTSGLTVPRGETFYLGERPSGAFTLSAYNRGSVTTTLVLARDGAERVVATIAPGETAIGRFESGDGMLVRNTSPATDALLTVEVWGTKDLAMYYRPNEG